MRSTADLAEGKELVVHANYELFVLTLTLLTIANSILLFLRLTVEQAQVVLIVNLGLSVFLLLDFSYRLWRTPHRRNFLGRDAGWLVLIGSLPVPFAGVARLIYTWLLVRRLRQSDYAKMGRVVVRRRAQSTLLLAVLAALLVLEIGALLVLDAEGSAASANIKTGSDALWWGIVTIATVGYGDKYPVTGAGRVIGVIVIVVGVGLFSALTSFLAQWFIRARAVDDEPQSNVSPEWRELSALSELLRAHEVRQLLADTQRPPAEVLAELKQKLQAGREK